MKIIFSIVLILLYLIPAIGVNGTVHYCGGEITSVTINGIGSDEKCPCGEKRKSSKCCNDENFSFQLEDNQYKSSQFYTKVEKEIDNNEVINSNIVYHYNFDFIDNKHFFDHPPPDRNKTALYILNQVFII